MGAAAEQILITGAVGMAGETRPTGVAENIESAGSEVAAAGHDTLAMMAAENIEPAWSAHTHNAD